MILKVGTEDGSQRKLTQYAFETEKFSNWEQNQNKGTGTSTHTSFMPGFGLQLQAFIMLPS